MVPEGPHLLGLNHQESVFGWILFGWIRNIHTLETSELRENKRLCAEMTQAHRNKKVLI